jgi:glucosamine-6-phosphate deaminase
MSPSLGIRNPDNPYLYLSFREFVLKLQNKMLETTLKVARMRIIIRSDAEQAGTWVAHYIIEKIRSFAPDSNRPFVLGLPTGSSPLPVYKELIRRNKAGEISFTNVITFNMDEYVGLPQGHSESYHTFMHSNLFQYVDIPSENIHILNGNAPDLEQECNTYEQLMIQYGGIELFLGGMGSDGHLAFNEPGSSLSSRTRIKTLRQETVMANARFFNGDISQVPTKALTVGVGTVMDSREVMLIVTGYAKARALREVIEGSISHMWTASVLQMHRRGIIVCDEEAATELRAETIRYFKSMEHDPGF